MPVKKTKDEKSSISFITDVPGRKDTISTVEKCVLLSELGKWFYVSDPKHLSVHSAGLHVKL